MSSRASFAFIERNFFLTRRYWGWEIALLVYATRARCPSPSSASEQDDPDLVLTLMIGAVFWNYLSIVFGFIAETVAWERWEGTLEYTFMAPIRRWTQLLGSTACTRSSTGWCTRPSCSSCWCCSSGWT